MADAIAKISWRIVGGQAQTDLIGGICGTCFSLDSGITLSCVHNTQRVFEPSKGFDECRVFVLEQNGAVTELFDGCLQPHSEYDTCLISGFTSSTTYRVSRKRPDKITACNLIGYEANTIPFECVVHRGSAAVDICNPDIASVVQIYNGLTPKPRALNVVALDMTIVNKVGYIIDVEAKLGISGGPMIDALDGSVVGISFLGLPIDVEVKTQLGAMDIRQLPFI